MKLLVFADLHFMDFYRWQEFLKIDHSKWDAVVLLGDIDIMLLKSIQEHFSDKPIIGILGNHDYVGDLEHYGIPNIHGKIATKGNISLLGVEGCLRYKKGEGYPLHEQEEISELLKIFPAVDIVLSHNSPKGIHEKPGIAHEGYEGLVKYMNLHSPRYLLHGHQHKNIRTTHYQTEVLGIYGGVLFDSDTGKTEILLDLDEME